MPQRHVFIFAEETMAVQIQNSGTEKLTSYKKTLGTTKTIRMNTLNELATKNAKKTKEHIH